jgi:hypothetical protein
VTKEICPKVDRLRGELARAKARDTAESELTPALAALRKASSGGGAQESAGPVMALLAFTGIHVGGWSSFIASLLMVIVEAGAIVVPMLMGAAFGERRRSVASGAGPDPDPGRTAPAIDAAGGDAASPQALPLGLTDRARRDLADVAAFLNACCERAAGKRVQSASLYVVYSEWKKARSEEPITVAQFGVVLTKHAGLAKLKSEGKNWYLGLRLRHPAQGRSGAKHLRAVAA